MQTDDRAERPTGRDQDQRSQDDEPVYVISIAAKLAGLPAWTLRVLDREGIVRPQRTAKDRRLYSNRDIALLARVRYLTEQRGVNMNGVRLILEMETHSEEAARPAPITPN